MKYLCLVYGEEQALQAMDDRHCVAYDEEIRTELGVSETAIGYVYSALLFAYMLCMTPGGWFIDHFGPRRAWMVLGFGSAVFVALTGWVGLLCATGTTLWLGLMGVRALMGRLQPVLPGHDFLEIRDEQARVLVIAARHAASDQVAVAAVVILDVLQRFLGQIRKRLAKVRHEGLDVIAPTARFM